MPRATPPRDMVRFRTRGPEGPKRRVFDVGGWLRQPGGRSASARCYGSDTSRLAAASATAPGLHRTHRVTPRTPTRMRQVVARLHPHPVIGRAPADVLQRQRHICGHRPCRSADGTGFHARSPNGGRSWSHSSRRLPCFRGSARPGADGWRYRADTLTALVHGRTVVRLLAVNGSRSVYVDDFVVLKPGRHAPVAGDAHGPTGRRDPLQGMKTNRPGRVTRLRCFLKPEQYPAKS